MVSYSLLSKYRSELMGFAILLVMAFHLSVCEYGEIGVEFFLVLSGVGLTFSRYNHPCKYPRYLIHRLMRVLPLYLIAASVYYYCIKQLPLSSITAVYNITFVSLLLNGNLTYWFIFIIICFYILFPFLEKVYSGFSQIYLICIAVALPLCFLMTSISPKNEILWARLPVCLLAVPVGSLVLKGQKTNIVLLVLSASLGCAIMALNKFGILSSLNIPINYVSCRRLSFFFLAIPALFACTLIVRLPVICKIMKFFGQMTLELYMVHEYFATPLTVKVFGNLQGCNEKYLLAFISIVIATAIAFCINKTLAPLLKRIEYRFLSLLPE